MNKEILGIDGLLALNGDRYFVDEIGNFEAIFKVACVAVTPERPHGLSYSLVLLNSKDAYTLVADFWAEVDKLV